MKTIVGVMGPGDQATPMDLKTAYALGNANSLGAGWVLLTGGRNGWCDGCRQPWGLRLPRGLTVGNSTEQKFGPICQML